MDPRERHDALFGERIYHSPGPTGPPYFVLTIAILCGALVYGTLALELFYVTPLELPFWHGPFDLSNKPTPR